MTVVLAVSPHLDDAAFSAGGTLAALAAAGVRVVAATVFTASVPDPQGFALACQLDKGLGPEVDYMALRRCEDQRACAALGVEARHLPLREAPHRGYACAADLFADVRDDDGAAADAASLIQALLEELEPALVLAPQAVGAHVDHIAVVRALESLGPHAPVAWWRDHPYTVRTDAPAEPFAASFRRLERVEAPMTAASHAAKVEAALAYASQLGFQFGGAQAARRVFEEAAPVERFRARPDGAATLRRLLGG